MSESTRESSSFELVSASSDCTEEDFMPVQEKRIQFHVVGAINLLPIGKQQRKPSTYVRIHAPDISNTANTFRTEAARHQLNPTWHENMHAIDMHTSCPVLFELMHQSRWPKQDVVLGSTRISLQSLLKMQGSIDRDHFVTLDLHPRPSLSNANMQLIIGVRELSSEKTVAQAVALAAKARATFPVEQPAQAPLAGESPPIRRSISKLVVVSLPLSQINYVPLRID